MAAATKSTSKKRKVVSFADLPSSDIDDQKDTSNTVVTSCDATPPLAVSTSTSSEHKVETKSKPVGAPEVSITPVLLTSLKKSVAAASTKQRESVPTLPQESGKSSSVERPYPPNPLRDILSDEESIASSASSFTSDTSSLLDQPTRRKRGGRRRGRGRGRKVLTSERSSETDLQDVEATPKTSWRGRRGRRRGRGRGGRIATDLTKAHSVEIVEEPLKAEG